MTDNMSVFADDTAGITAASYGYALNDTIAEYGVIKTQNPDDALIDETGAEINPGGTVYADLISFEENSKPYLVIFTANSDTSCAEVHIWKYDSEQGKAVEIAEITKPYNTIQRNRMGEFNIGYNDEKRYISYKEYENNVLISEEYYTVMDSDAVMFVNTPKNVYDVGVMNFNCAYFHPGIDVSNYNKTLDNFFMKLKNDAADSVTYEDISERLKTEYETQIEKVLAKAVGYSDFDIMRFKSMEEYRTALDMPNCSDRFYLITNMYNLGDEIYYVRFSTDRSFYNYTLLRRTDSTEDGYQILKVRADCIPLSDKELENIKADYSRSTLLFKKSRSKMPLKTITAEFDINLPKLDIEKMFDSKIRVPAALIGGGVCLALMTFLWFVIASDDE